MKRKYVLINVAFLALFILFFILSIYFYFFLLIPFFFLPIICYLPFIFKRNRNYKRSPIDREINSQEKETEIKKEQELRFCSQCGGQIKEPIARYCYHCGAKLIDN
jgi:Ca2+/Na+ antiporter